MGYGWALWVLALFGLLCLARASSDWLIAKAQREADALRWTSIGDPSVHPSCRCTLAGAELMRYPATTAAYERDRMLAAMAARRRTDVQPIEFDDLDHLTRLL